MNIFYVEKNPRLAAMSLHDKHVVKMTLETAQILSTIIHRAYPDTVGFYKPTHKSHPSVKWAGDTIDNFRWLVRHGLALADEYTFRFGKVHKSREVILKAAHLIEAPAHLQITQPPQCMPDQYKVPGNSIAAYRAYYLAEKIQQSRWTKRPAPAWINLVA